VTHSSLDGSSFGARIARFYPRTALWSVGELVVAGSPDLDQRQLARLWLASPAHRAFLLSRRWRELGVGIARAASAPGPLAGLTGVTIVVVDAGRR
jgi:uncharacterized protein YkwD